MPAEIRKQSHVQVIRSMLSDNVLGIVKRRSFLKTRKYITKVALFIFKKLSK
jgi:hypothetical protein